MNPAKAYMMLVFVMVLWTSGIVVAKTIGDVIGILEFSLWRWGIASIVLFPFALPILKNRLLEIVKRRRQILFLGTLLAGGSTLLVWSVQLTSVINAALVSATQPIVTVGLMWLLFSQKIEKRQSVGIVFASIGVVLIITMMDFKVLVALAFNKGDLIVLIAVLFYSFYTIYLNEWFAVFSPISIMFLTSLVATLILILISLMMREVPFKPFEPAIAKSLIYMAVVPTALATTMWNAAIRIVGPNKGSAFINLMPVLGAIASILIFHEAPKTYHILGTVLTCVGLSFVLKESPPTQRARRAEN